MENNEIMNADEVTTDIVETSKSGSNMGIGILIGASVVLGVNALYKLGKKGVAYYKAKKNIGNIKVDIDSENNVK